MPRVSHVVASLKRKKRVFKRTKGFWGGRSRLYRSAIETMRRGLAFAYRDRRDRKGDFRQLWITRINAACKGNGVRYSRFIDGLKKANVAIDRKMLAELAVTDAAAFTELVKVANNALINTPTEPKVKKISSGKRRTAKSSPKDKK